MKLRAGLALVTLLACSEDRGTSSVAPVYRDDMSNLLRQKCAGCHGDVTPAADWRATSFLGTLGCVNPGGQAATLPPDTRAPILQALDDDTHRALIDDASRARLAAWVTAGTPAFRTTVHPPGIIDPRSDAWHGTLLRSAHYAPMLDRNDALACGRCHDGSPTRPAGVTLAAPHATDCRSCHSDGPLGCGTCHGRDTHASPPRDSCFFPTEAARSGAHEAHVASSPSRSGGLPCAACHPTPTSGGLGGTHINGYVEVTFDPVLAGPAASYDRSSGGCTVACHDHGGARPHPSWTDTLPMRCGDCHASPPANHYPGACSSCHQQANATGSALAPGPLHLSGKVDLGDGSGKCGACHGRGDDPWPTTSAHSPHESPTVTAPLPCVSCHVVPTSLKSPGHLDGVVQIALGGHALDRGSSPSWNGTSCTQVGCHGAGLTEPAAVVPIWADTSHAAKACTACHGVPPLQHTPSIACERVECHGGEVSRSGSTLSITTSGKALHINGVIDLRAP